MIQVILGYLNRLVLQWLFFRIVWSSEPGIYCYEAWLPLAQKNNRNGQYLPTLEIGIIFPIAPFTGWYCRGLRRFIRGQIAENRNTVPRRPKVIWLWQRAK